MIPIFCLNQRVDVTPTLTLMLCSDVARILDEWTGVTNVIHVLRGLCVDYHY
jgi:hypothetical protein